MATSIQDFQLAAVAAGFTIGFGFLTVWEAIKQTRQNHNPLRSAYIYMVWGEILANVGLGILAWLFVNDIVEASVPLFFFILFFWVFEIQLLMQIIINRIALIAEHRRTVQRIKWGTLIVISTINIGVFTIFIPAHIVPPPSQIFVDINAVWDKVSKVLILIVDAGLNWYFLHNVKVRLVQRVGLKKYEPLVRFNAKLMMVSIAMDALLIGLMFLKNQVVFVQFHPVVYMVKLNIEMSMASLIVRLARGKEVDTDIAMFESSTDPPNPQQQRSAMGKSQIESNSNHFQSLELTPTKGMDLHSRDNSDDLKGQIRCRTDLNVVVEQVNSITEDGGSRSSIGSNEAPTHSLFADETPLRKEDSSKATSM